MPTRVVFFDFGGTLARGEPLIHEPWRAWVKAAADLGLSLDERRIREVNERADRRFGGSIYQYHGRTAEFWKIRDLWAIEQLGVRSMRQEYFDALQAIFNDFSLIHPYPETEEVLRDLRGRGLRLGVISNFNDALLRVLEFHRLDAYFDSVTYSQGVGVEKPDPAIFGHALAAMHTPAEESLHIGDSWASDYLGAKGAGLRAVWLNREGKPAPAPCDEVRDLRGLGPMIHAGPARGARR